MLGPGAAGRSMLVLINMQKGMVARKLVLGMVTGVCSGMIWKKAS